MMRLLYAFPLTFLEIFIFTALAPDGFSLPTMTDLGREAEIAIRIGRPQHLLYVAQKTSIEPSYDEIIAKLQFRVVGANGREVPTDPVKRFFYSAPQGSEMLHAGSVFVLRDPVDYPFVGRLQSNIRDFPQLQWVISDGSFAAVVGLFFACLLLNLTGIWWLFVRKRNLQRTTV